MFIKEIQLENFKCFENSTFQFEKQFTTIIGDNGSGKTALLDGIARGLKIWLSEPIEEQKQEVQEDEVRFIYNQSSSKKQLLLQLPLSIRMKIDDIINDVPYQFRSEEVGFKTYENNFGIEYMDGIMDFNKSLFSIDGEKGTLPIIAYYKTNRLFFIEKKNNGELNTYPIKNRLKTYRDCLKISIKSNQLFEWIKRMKFIELQEKEIIPELQAVKNSIIQALHGLHPNKNNDIDFDVRSDELFMTIDDKIYPFNSLSDGYRNTLGMIGDIAYRMAELNPHLTTNSPGVVLIDELDLHLHPKWQRHIVGDLKRIFPNCQFIVTTHSPFIIQSLKSGELLKLGENSEIEQDDFTKKSIEDIAEDEQGVEMPQRSVHLTEMYETAKKYYQKLEIMNGDMTKEEKKRLREELHLLTERYSDEVAYIAFLEQKRLVKETQTQK
jgi:predicted ATP-binding protein involved in virulence